MKRRVPTAFAAVKGHDLRAAIARVFGARAEVQRCQLHKRRNVAEYLPKNAQGDYDRRIQNAYGMTNYADAKAELEKIFRNWSA